MKRLPGLRRLRQWLVPATALLLGGCVISTPFEDTGDARMDDANDVVIVSITHVMLTDDRAQRDRFWAQVGKVQDTLEGRPGLLGYSLRRELLGSDAWTMTVWRDEASLQAFVSSPTHLAAMRDGMPGLRGARFARFEVARERIPLAWDTALAYLETHARGYGDAY